MVLIDRLRGLAIWTISKRSGGLGSAVAFVRSRHKVTTRGKGSVTFDDVAGNDEVVTELREIVDFLKTPGRFQATRRPDSQRGPAGRPAGDGQDLAGQGGGGRGGGAVLLALGFGFQRDVTSASGRPGSATCSQAAAKAPCLIFIDELDAIGKARSNGGGFGGADERDQTLNQLLVAMDGFDSGLGVIVMAATNRPETLDSALVRPGRFDRNVTIDRPDIAGREQILKVHTRKVALEDQINLRHIAAMTPGFVGADLANLVNEAALLAASKGKDRVGRVEFEEGVERVVAGPEKKQRVLEARREAEDRLPRGGPRPRLPEPAPPRPGPQGLDPRPGQRHPRLHDVPARGRPLLPHPGLARGR